MPINWLKKNLKNIVKYKYVIRYFEYLQTQPVLKIICYNLILDRQNNCCNEMTINTYLETLDNVLKAMSPDDVKKTEPKNIFREARYKCNIDLPVKPINFSKNKSMSISVCRIMTRERFFYYANERTPKYLEDLDDGFNFRNETLINLESRAGFLWVTERDEMDKLLGDNPDEAEWQRALEITGLNNMGSSKLNVKNKYTMVYYPKSNIPPKTSQPTFIEGGDNPLFRIQPLQTGWNQAVDLGKSYFGQPGHPEVIHAPAGLAEVEYTHFDVPFSENINYDKLFNIIKTLVK